MKDIRNIIKKVVSETVDPPKSEDEKRFVAKHEVEVIDYPAGSTTQFKSKTKKDKTTDKKPADGAEDGSVYEETMTDAQKKKREEIVKSMKKKMGEFKDRYGDKAKDVMYATATKQAMSEETDLKTHKLKEDVDLDEAYQKSMGYKGAEDMIRRLGKLLSPDSVLAKSISKNADNVIPEFKKMQKHMKEIQALWDEVERTVDMSEGVSYVDGTELSEAVLDNLKKIASNKQAGRVKFEDGDTLKVDLYTASALMKIYDALNGANKEKFAKALNKNETMFM